MLVHCSMKGRAKPGKVVGMVSKHRTAIQGSWLRPCFQSSMNISTKLSKAPESTSSDDYFFESVVSDKQVWLLANSIFNPKHSGSVLGGTFEPKAVFRNIFGNGSIVGNEAEPGGGHCQLAFNLEQLNNSV